MAAQDEFYRSECPLHLPHAHSLPPTRPLPLLSYPGMLGGLRHPHLKESALHLSSQMTSLVFTSLTAAFPPHPQVAGH